MRENSGKQGTGETELIEGWSVVEEWAICQYPVIYHPSSPSLQQHKHIMPSLVLAHCQE